MKTYRAVAGKVNADQLRLDKVLLKLTSLAETVLSDAALKGAVWLQRKGKGKIQRERDIRIPLDPTDLITFYYDPRVLSLPEYNNPELLEENSHYGIWIKPAGIMSQGTQTGDHASLLRAVEKKLKKEVFLVHRLDRETKGLMVISYGPQSAAKLGELFQKNQIQKTYEAIVLGGLELGKEGKIEASLDGKEAVTFYKVIKSQNNQSLLEVRIETGRLHQIRRHLNFLGHPILGDPKYGRGNKNKEGLKLQAQSLGFKDPWDKKVRSWSLPDHLHL
jgi:tRNA pseudouridine32 synthase / 23S rRNA pseudouridine746 synthase